MCHSVQGDSVAKRQPFLRVVVGVLGVVTSGVACTRVPRASRDVLTTGCRSCATENTYKFDREHLQFMMRITVVINLLLSITSLGRILGAGRLDCRT